MAYRVMDFQGEKWIHQLTYATVVRDGKQQTAEHWFPIKPAPETKRACTSDKRTIRDSDRDGS